jgi:hypothetical protein
MVERERELSEGTREAGQKQKRPGWSQEGAASRPAVERECLLQGQGDSAAGQRRLPKGASGQSGEQTRARRAPAGNPTPPGVARDPGAVKTLPGRAWRRRTKERGQAGGRSAPAARRAVAAALAAQQHLLLEAFQVIINVRAIVPVAQDQVGVAPPVAAPARKPAAVARAAPVQAAEAVAAGGREVLQLDELGAAEVAAVAVAEAAAGRVVAAAAAAAAAAASALVLHKLEGDGADKDGEDGACKQHLSAGREGARSGRGRCQDGRN